MIVFDASLALKWYLDEAYSDEAHDQLVQHSGNIAVPGIFVSEVIGALVRRTNADKSLRGEVENSIGQLVSLTQSGQIDVRHLSPAQVATASALALDLGHPLKDCLYLALAMELGCDLVTCDARFAAKAKTAWDRVRLLGE